MNQNMTALISAFARLYHTKNSKIKIYDDKYADKIISENEYHQISENMKNGIHFFNPNYKGDDPLKWIVNNNLAPSVLARSIFNQKHLLNQMNLGVKQYVILASGYDTSGLQVQNKVKVFELDKEEMIKDKISRIRNAKLENNIIYVKTDFNSNWVNDLLNTQYNSNEKTFCSMLGISYYLDKETFKSTIKDLASIMPNGSAIVFDYPNTFETKKEKLNQQLAKEANEEMKSKYTSEDIEDIARQSNMFIFEHLDYNDIDSTYFNDYNLANPNDKINAPKGVSYVMLLKK